jgi:Arc/MetJ-type ribon-helix-helix transcriptional regulator
METISLKIEPKFLSAIQRIMKKHNYVTKTEFIRESLRDKIKILEEKEILGDKEVMSQLKESEKNINKEKITKFEY